MKNAHPDKKLELKNFLKSEGLQAMVTNAITNPGSDAAKSLLRRVEPFMNFAANQIPYSNAQGVSVHSLCQLRSQGATVNFLYTIQRFKGRLSNKIVFSSGKWKSSIS